MLSRLIKRGEKVIKAPKGRDLQRIGANRALPFMWRAIVFHYGQSEWTEKDLLPSHFGQREREKVAKSWGKKKKRASFDVEMKCKHVFGENVVT